MTAAFYARAEKLAAALPPLLIEAERIARSVWHGTHGRRRAGIGENFWQFRRYGAGDPATRIDWRQSARTDKLYVRERERETAQTACLWADASGSMRYASDKNLPTKADEAKLLLLALASLLLRGGERVRWAEAGSFAPLHGREGLERVAIAPATGDSAPPLPNLRHAAAIFASDFLMPPDALQQTMRLYAAQNLHGVLLHIVDPLEQSFDLDGRIELQGLEGEAAQLVTNASAMREGYRRRFTAHGENLLRVAESAGWFYLRHVTGTSRPQSLLKLYQYLAA